MVASAFDVQTGSERDPWFVGRDYVKKGVSGGSEG